MAFLDDFQTAVSSYLRDSVTLSIVNARDPGQGIHVGEGFTFSVRLENNGYLDMDNVIVRIQGGGFAKVAMAGGSLPTKADVDSPKQKVPAQEHRDFGPFFVLVKGYIPGMLLPLFKATVQTWDPSLETLLQEVSDPPVTAEAVYQAIVTDH